MAKAMTVEGVKKMSAPGLHKDKEPGLYLKIRHNKQGDVSQKSWLFRWKVPGTNRVREMGLGGADSVSLKAAREAAQDASRIVGKGGDPIAARHIEQAQQAEAVAVEQAKGFTFDMAVKRYIAEKVRPESKNKKHVQQWENTLATYASPVIGKLPLDAISTDHVLEILAPIWSVKTETAHRVQQRISRIMDWARIMKLREGDNVARWAGYLDQVLPAPDKVRNEGQGRKHFTSMPYSECSDFMVLLKKRPATAARALELAILTACRSGEVRGARWSEMDLKARTWTIPAGRMKAKREHRIPLSPAAVRVIKAQQGLHEEFVFPNSQGKELSNMAMENVLRRMNLKPITVHGFRSSFRTWAAEQTHYPREVAELALAHKVGTAVELAYQHSDLIEKRRKLMIDWARFLTN
ncbi:MAG: site-specific integrase [Halioglobus sp.]